MNSKNESQLNMLSVQQPKQEVLKTKKGHNRHYLGDDENPAHNLTPSISHMMARIKKLPKKCISTDLNNE
jgi:hypothetical protein